MNTLVGGNFQTFLGQPLSNGYLVLELSHDGQGSGNTQIVAGTKVTVPLDNTGNVAGTGVSIWANDTLLPSGSFYWVEVHASDGRIVSSPQRIKLTVTSTPSPFNLGVNWVPS